MDEDDTTPGAPHHAGKVMPRPHVLRVVEDHFRRLDAAIYGPCPIQETARAFLGIEEIRD